MPCSGRRNRNEPSFHNVGLVEVFGGSGFRIGDVEEEVEAVEEEVEASTLAALEEEVRQRATELSGNKIV